ncbi:ATP-binding protein [Streptomyces sp. NPDC002896]|uniref:ATP-binding protein n=1 Tax=Streptomyces sp. NPDC002896 TaxID=3154438 RepID=UPI003327ECAF
MIGTAVDVGEGAYAIRVAQGAGGLSGGHACSLAESARRRGTPRGHVASSIPYTYDPRVARIARRTLRAVLAEHGMTELADPAELLTCELVTNAYRHSKGPAALRLRALDGGRLRLSVWDSNPHIPPPFDRGHGPFRPVVVPGEAERGRGLFLVCHYAQAWGGWPLGDDLFGRGGKLLWCELGAARFPAPNGTALTCDATQVRAVHQTYAVTPARVPEPEST